MKYLQVEIQLDHEDIEPVTGLLLAAGITETAVEDPADLEDIMDKKTGYEWDYIDETLIDSKKKRPHLMFYLDEDEEERAELLRKQINDLFPGAAVNITFQDDSCWKDKWKEYFKPAKVTDKLVVKPTWEDYISKRDEIVIDIDPGMAFGTGTHETTSMCLKLMEKYMKKGNTVLDVGCGSGILSIGAAKLGASETLAVDIDPEAVKVTYENVMLNRCDDRVYVREANLVEGVDFTADMVVANLMADLVMMLSHHVAGHMNDGGIYISSGILTEKEKEVSEVIRKEGFQIIEIMEDDMWCAIAARKK